MPTFDSLLLAQFVQWFKLCVSISDSDARLLNINIYIDYIIIFVSLTQYLNSMSYLVSFRFSVGLMCLCLLAPRESLQSLRIEPVFNKESYVFGE